MTDRPITFSGPMVHALLAGTKTQTRRALAIPDGVTFDAVFNDNGVWSIGDALAGPEHKLPVRYRVGDRLYVREHWRTVPGIDDMAPKDMIPHLMPIRYEADEGRTNIVRVLAASGRFRQAMHMPRWASRITLHVTEVRVQRLHEINPADAIAEGIELVRETAQWGKHWRNYGAEGYDDRSPIYSYRTLWNSLRGHTGEHQLPVEPWSENPWVTATTFEVERCHIDQARAA